MSHEKDLEITDFSTDIKKQIRLLKNNCNVYDQGEFEHSLAIASNLRTILHTANKKSQSLISHTGIEHNYKFYTSQKTPYETIMCLLLCTTAQIKMDSDKYNKFVFLPTLFDQVTVDSGYIKFKKWWNQKVIISNSHRYSRKDLVLLSANEHGGTHIDSFVNKSFNDLIKDIESPLSYVKGSQPNMSLFNAPIKNYVYAAIRQIAHEVLITFKQIENIDFDYAPKFTNFEVKKEFSVANLILNKGERRYPND